MHAESAVGENNPKLVKNKGFHNKEQSNCEKILVQILVHMAGAPPFTALSAGLHLHAQSHSLLPISSTPPHPTSAARAPGRQVPREERSRWPCSAEARDLAIRLASVQEQAGSPSLDGSSLEEGSHSPPETQPAQSGRL